MANQSTDQKEKVKMRDRMKKRIYRDYDPELHDQRQHQGYAAQPHRRPHRRMQPKEACQQDEVFGYRQEFRWVPTKNRCHDKHRLYRQPAEIHRFQQGTYRMKKDAQRRRSMRWAEGSALDLLHEKRHLEQRLHFLNVRLHAVNHQLHHRFAHKGRYTSRTNVVC